MILNVHGLLFQYNSHPVLDDVRFEVKRGELLAILGPNGVGKTTLLKCINAIHRPAAGSVQVEDLNVLACTPLKIAQKVGYVAQRNEVSRLTVFDAVLMGRKPHIRWGTGERDLCMTDAVLRQLGLKHMELRFIDQLSGGELQKVAIARALVQEPRLLLLDEPTSALDMRNQMEIMTLLKHIVDSHGLAAVMTMHDLNTALRFAHKYLFLKDGKVFAAGNTTELCGSLVEEVYGLPVEIHQLNGYPFVVPMHMEEPAHARHL